MKRVAVLVTLLIAFGASEAQAIEGQRAVRHIKLAVKEDCNSYRSEGATCLYWEVSHCFELGRSKVRCKALQQYRLNGNWRECRFHASAVERAGLVHLYFGRTQCYSESGEPI
jgi:hypothetical protein